MKVKDRLGEEEGKVAGPGIIIANFYTVFFMCQVLSWVFYRNYYLIPSS